MKITMLSLFSAVLLSSAVFFITPESFAQESDKIFDIDKCNSIIPVEQFKTIADLNSEEIFFDFINEDLTELNSEMHSGCAFDFENEEGTVAVSFLAAQFISPEEVTEKRDMALQGAEAMGITMNEGVLENGWNYFFLDINDSGLGIMMNSYRENLSITINVPLVGGGESQPFSEEHLKNLSSVMHSNLELAGSKDVTATNQNKIADGFDEEKTAEMRMMLSSYMFTGQSPLRQIQDGILPENVTCNEGLEMLYKNNDGGFPACVQSDSKMKLIQRGWGVLP